MNGSPLVRSLAPVLLLAASVWGAYHNSVGGVLFWDDNETIVDNVYIKNPAYIKKIFQTSYHAGSGYYGPYYRPLTSLSFMLDYHLGKLKPSGYHLTNILIHSLNVLLLFFLLRRIVGGTFVPSLTALLFGIHPLNSEAVNYVSNRTDLLMLFFFLLGFLSYIRFRIGKNPVYFVLTCLFYGLSVLSKEMGIVLPLFLILYDRVVHPNAVAAMVQGIRSATRSKSGARRVKRLMALHRRAPVLSYGVLGGLFLSYVVLRLTVLSFYKLNPLTQGAQAEPYSRDLLVRLLTFAEGGMVYWRLFVWPLGLHMEYDRPLISGRFDPSGWLALGAWLILIGLLFLWGKKDWRISFGAWWFLLGLFPVMGIIVPINNVISEHYLYVACIGIFLCAAAAAQKLWRLQKIFTGGLILILALVLGGVTFERNKVWSDPLKMFLDIISKTKTSFRAHVNAGYHYDKMGDQAKAQYHWKKSLEIFPDYWVALNNLGFAAYRKGDYAAAEDFYKRAVQSCSDFLLARRNLAELYMAQKKYAQALEQLQHVLKTYPEDPWASRRMMVVLKKWAEEQGSAGAAARTSEGP
ncbi:MAG: tetratricopeptide repeat protein [Candidatus Omnitrophica bacterium]|nr:tetratricopeptide repeat protein [Candidatus Omnitrophota bacterium]